MPFSQDWRTLHLQFAKLSYNNPAGRRNSSTIRQAGSGPESDRQVTGDTSVAGCNKRRVLLVCLRPRPDTLCRGLTNSTSPVPSLLLSYVVITTFFHHPYCESGIIRRVRAVGRRFTTHSTDTSSSCNCPYVYRRPQPSVSCWLFG